MNTITIWFYNRDIVTCEYTYKTAHHLDQVDPNCIYMESVVIHSVKYKNTDIKKILSSDDLDYIEYRIMEVFEDFPRNKIAP